MLPGVGYDRTLHAIDCTNPNHVEAHQTGNCTQRNVLTDILQSPKEEFTILQETLYFTYRAFRCKRTQTHLIGQCGVWAPSQNS